MLGGGEDDDVGDGCDGGERAEEDPPWGEAGRGVQGYDLVVLWEVGDEDAEDEEAGRGRLDGPVQGR